MAKKSKLQSERRPLCTNEGDLYFHDYLAFNYFLKDIWTLSKSLIMIFFMSFYFMLQIRKFID